MLTLTQRLGTLDPKAKLATRTAKDGEEYSQLVFEVTELEVDESEVNALRSSPHAYRAMKSLFEADKGIKAIEFDEKIEGATVVVRLAAVSAQNGPEFTFSDCRIDKLKLGRLESDALHLRYRVTAKPALNSLFGELVARFGHTAMIELRGESPNAQADLPLNSVGANESARPSLGTPKEEREKAHAREREIAAELETAHVTNDGKKKKSRGSDPVVKTEKVDTAKRRKSVDGATVN
jgi:hypothetical protein